MFRRVLNRGMIGISNRLDGRKGQGFMRQIREEDHAVVMVDDGQVVAEVGYKSIDDHSLVIDHTFVSEKLRGQKIGKELIDKVVQMAREQHKKSFPHARTHWPCSSVIKNIVTSGSSNRGECSYYKCINITTSGQVFRLSRCFFACIKPLKWPYSIIDMLRKWLF